MPKELERVSLHAIEPDIQRVDLRVGARRSAEAIAGSWRFGHPRPRSTGMRHGRGMFVRLTPPSARWPWVAVLLRSSPGRAVVNIEASGACRMSEGRQERARDPRAVIHWASTLCRLVNLSDHETNERETGPDHVATGGDTELASGEMLVAKC